MPPERVRARILFAVGNLRPYLLFVEQHLEAAHAAEAEEVRSIEQALIDTYGDDLWTDADVEILQERWGCDDPDAPDTPYSPLHAVLPRALRYAFVMLVGFVLESELRVLCQWLAEQKGLPAPENWNRSVLAKARGFLTQQAGVTVVDGHTWNALFDLMKVRNCIAHVGGRVDAFAGRARLEDLAAQDSGLWIDADERPGLRLLVIEHAYCERIVATVESVFEAILDPDGEE